MRRGQWDCGHEIRIAFANTVAKRPRSLHCRFLKQKVFQTFVLFRCQPLRQIRRDFEAADARQVLQKQLLRWSEVRLAEIHGVGIKVNERLQPLTMNAGSDCVLRTGMVRVIQPHAEWDVAPIRRNVRSNAHAIAQAERRNDRCAASKQIRIARGFAHHAQRVSIRVPRAA